MRNNKAFTLMELIITVACIGVVLVFLFAVLGWFKTVALFVMSWAFIGVCIIVALIIGFFYTRKKFRK